MIRSALLTLTCKWSARWVDEFFFELRQQRIRDCRRLPDAFMDRALGVCRNLERTVAGVQSVCVNVFENKRQLLEDYFNIEQETKFLKGPTKNTVSQGIGVGVGKS